MGTTQQESMMPGPGALRAAFGTIVAASAAPYGYTVTIWTSGAVLMHYRGTPSVFDAFVFLAGALSGFGVVALSARGALDQTEPLGRATDRVVAGTLHWFAVGGAVGSVALLGRIDRWVAWPLASFAATAIYLVAASIQLAVIATRLGAGPQG
jgi:hypothetical protein